MGTAADPNDLSPRVVVLQTDKDTVPYAIAEATQPTSHKSLSFNDAKSNSRQGCWLLALLHQGVESREFWGGTGRMHEWQSACLESTSVVARCASAHCAFKPACLQM